MKIKRFDYPDCKIYKCRLGDLSVPRNRQRNPKLFPTVTAGQVGVEVDRQTSATGILTWRKG